MHSLPLLKHPDAPSLLCRRYSRSGETPRSFPRVPVLRGVIKSNTFTPHCAKITQVIFEAIASALSAEEKFSVNYKVLISAKVWLEKLHLSFLKWCENEAQTKTKLSCCQLLAK